MKVTRKSLIGITLLIAIVAAVGVTATFHKAYEMQVRSAIGTDNPVIIDLYKLSPDDSLVASGWRFLGIEQAGPFAGRYHYQFTNKNLITNSGASFLAARVAGAATDTGHTARFIALSADSVAPAATDTTVIGEQTINGLSRASGNLVGPGTAASGDITWSVVYTFTATAAVNSVQKAGLFTTAGYNQVTLFAETTFAAVKPTNQKFVGTSLASGDTLTITWIK